MKCAKNDKKSMLIDVVFLFLTGAFLGWLYEVLRLFLWGLVRLTKRLSFFAGPWYTWTAVSEIWE